MPKSRSRPKGKQRRGYAAPTPAPKRKPKTSSKWYGPLLLVVMGAGVLVIVLNYMGLFGGAQQQWLYVGLGLIAVGFVGATRWR